MNKESTEKFKKLAEEYGAQLNLDFSDDNQYAECQIVKGDIHIYIIFTVFEEIYLAYNLNSDIAPSELYLDLRRDTLETRKLRDIDIFDNTNRMLGKDLNYIKTPSVFNRSRGYIELVVEGKVLKLWQKRNVWGLDERKG